jgi:hypothetical protein
MQARTSYDVAFFLALFSTALALGAAMAHALELPNKIALPRDAYFIVQGVYAGWDRLGYFLGVELLSMVAVAYLGRAERGVLWSTVIALMWLLAAQAVFWIYTYPANVATQNWTAIPDNWPYLRDTWEYSHAAGAAFQAMAMAALIVAALARKRA